MAAILVVDDEPAVLKMLARILRGAGFHVFEADAPERALEIADEVQCGLNLLVTDIQMPRMPGDELLRQIRMKCPFVDALAISGALPKGSPGLTGIPVLQKPFGVDELVATVKEMLSRQIP
jgi:two-component system, cell cycle sensor histidine kinase and response regulator CckA